MIVENVVTRVDYKLVQSQSSTIRDYSALLLNNQKGATLMTAGEVSKKENDLTHIVLQLPSFTDCCRQRQRRLTERPIQLSHILFNCVFGTNFFSELCYSIVHKVRMQTNQILLSSHSEESTVVPICI